MEAVLQPTISFPIFCSVGEVLNTDASISNVAMFLNTFSKAAKK